MASIPFGLAPLVPILLAGSTLAARAADHTNLEEGLPVTIEDAYPIKQNGIEFQYYTQYDRTHRDLDGKHRVNLVPRIEWGAFPNFQFSVASPYRVGDATETRQGDVDVQGLYNFNTEGVVVPAMSLLAGVAQPYGRLAGGTETEFEFLATKSIGAWDVTGSTPLSYAPRELHFNAAWFHDYDPSIGRDAERDDRYRVGVGYSQPVTNDLVAVADVYRETDRERGKADNVAEIGVRYMLTPQTVLSGSLGAGFGGDRAGDFRAVVGFQHTLSVPYGRP
jgi:hypothetical protein